MPAESARRRAGARLRGSLLSRDEAHGIDRRERVRNAGPAVALVLAHPNASGGGTEGQSFARLVEGKRMPVDDIVGMLLREALAQHVEALAAVARARDHELALARDAFLVLDLGDEPGGIRLARMHDHGESERRWLDPGNLGERPSFVGRDENAVVVLYP